ncbi:MAG: 5-(carboxyamino)imidazole ribonucleotide synthase [Caulobacteraceae bacterium]
MTTPRFPLAPGSTIGVLGGGQLGRMLAAAAARLGFDVAVLDPDPAAPAARVAAHAVAGAYDDPAALARLAALSDVVTFEFENVPAAAVETLVAEGAEVAPSGRALAVSQDRLTEKTFLAEIGAPTVAFAEVNGAKDIETALETLGRPLLVKSRRGGYDGKGQAWVQRPEEAAAVFAAIGAQAAIAEAPADFRRELSVIAARGRDGEIALFPLAENHHEAGILRRTVAPASASAQTAAQAERIAASLLAALDYVGVIGIELFERDDGRLLVNEFAPRVHNTGHWTLDGCEADQFEQHIRAVAGWPLAPAHAIARVEMTNLIGDDAADWRRLSAEPETRLWLYGKAEARPGRKMGHVNRLSALKGRT